MWPDGVNRFPGLYVVCPKAGLVTAFLHYLPDITRQEVPCGIKKMLLRIANLKAVFVSLPGCQKVE